MPLSPACAGLSRKPETAEPTPEAPVGAMTAQTEPEEPEQKTWRIRFQPNRELLLCGSNPIGTHQ